MTIHTEADLAGLKSAGQVVSDVLRRMCQAAEPGMTMAELAGFAGLGIGPLSRTACGRGLG